MRIKLIFIIVGIFTLNILQSQSDCRNIGINLYFNKYWSREMPFADLMIQASQWLDQDFNLISVKGSDFDDHTGYPKAVPFMMNGKELLLKRIVCLDNGGINPSGLYDLYFEGDGIVELEGEDVDSLIFSSNNKKTYKISPKSKGEIILSVKLSSVANPIKNIKLMLPGTDPQKDIFNPIFLEKLKPFSTIRFLNWTETNNNTIANWNDRITPEYYDQTTEYGLSYEYIIELCNKLGKDMWLNIPHAADDQFIYNLADLLDRNLDKKLKLYLEYSNEAWNTIFPVFNWIDDKGASLHSEHQYRYAYFAGQSYKKFKNVYQSGNLIRVLGGQQAWSEIALRSANGMEYFNLEDTYDAISCTGYLYLTPQDQNIIKNLGDDLTTDTVFDMLETNMRNTVKKNMEYHADIAHIFNKKLITYESCPYPLVQYNQFGNPPDYANKLYETIYDPRMKDLYSEWINILFDDLDLDLMMAFVLADNNNAHYGSFGHLDNIFQTEPFIPAYQALFDAGCRNPINSIYFYHDNNDVFIYPNPIVDNQCNILSENNLIHTVKVCDIQGKTVDKFLKIANLEFSFSTVHYKRGFYILKIELENGKIIFKKMLLP